ncbi:MAG: beta-ketoacyl-[acyl-carrier-protein] synthase family protein [Candidatus Omnitrophota bacterium]|nr:beta-ketoacyl-[acyl-carrier-protein] synthase family protein [Candidatus Omnitrophota bacterium]
MADIDAVITGIGVIAPSGIGKEIFWKGLEAGLDTVSEVTAFDTGKFNVHCAAEIKNFSAEQFLGAKGLRSIDRSALVLMVAAQQAIEEAKLEIIDATTDDFGVCTGTTFSHLGAIIEFDREVLRDGLEFSNPAFFPSTVINAASSQVSIRFNIQGFNTTISTGFTAGLDALKYSIDALATNKAKTVLTGSVDVLTSSLFFGFHKLGYMAGLTGPALSCPFDARRNGPVLGEAATVFCVEDAARARSRGVKIYARIKSVACHFDAFRMGKIHPQGLGIEKAIVKALRDARLRPADIDYISSCANSSKELDSIEVKVLRRVFGDNLKRIPVSSVKSMLGETFSAAGPLQIVSCLGAMHRGIIPPTINYQEKDALCDIDCVPNVSRKRDVRRALITSFGPGGYNSACVLERWEN